MTGHDPNKCIDCIRSDLAFMVASQAAALGLRIVGSFSGESYVFADGRVLRADLDPDPDGRAYWRSLDLDKQAILAAAHEMVEAIATKHGPGNVWTLCDLPLVHIVKDDGLTVVNGRVRLRRLYAHEAAVTP